MLMWSVVEHNMGDWVGGIYGKDMERSQMRILSGGKWKILDSQQFFSMDSPGIRWKLLVWSRSFSIFVAFWIFLEGAKNRSI